jgi:hypothetical protein
MEWTGHVACMGRSGMQVFDGEAIRKETSMSSLTGVKIILRRDLKK